LPKQREFFIILNPFDIHGFIPISRVKLVSGSVSHQNPGNQFGHASSIFTIILLSITAVLQIICLNRGLRVYDSTLVVPVFYGIYTATGWDSAPLSALFLFLICLGRFLDSLIFNDQVDSYKSWTLFLIFVSILILISGVVLLTHKKPEHTPTPPGSASVAPIFRSRRSGVTDKMGGDVEAGEGGPGASETLWTVGGESDDEAAPSRPPRRQRGGSRKGEGASLIKVGDDLEGRRSGSSDATLSPNDDQDPFRDEPDEYAGWEDVDRSGKGKGVR
jgi:magnesium transporter